MMSTTQNIGELVGQASTLFYNEKTKLLDGVFDEKQAQEIVDKIQALITEKLVKLANLYGEPRCENLHHAKKNQHTSIEDCPVEKAINEQLKKNK